jgi:hypothetical protein
MRTVHETEALRPSDPVPKHHSSNPSNNKQRIRLILNANDKKLDKGSTPGSPASHSHPPSAPIPPPPSDVDYAHNNVIYIQDLAAPSAPTMVQFPPDNPSQTASSRCLRQISSSSSGANSNGRSKRATNSALKRTRSRSCGKRNGEPRSSWSRTSWKRIQPTTADNAQTAENQRTTRASML